MSASTVPVLATPRLHLRALRVEDAPAIYAYAHDAAVARFVSWPRHRSLDDATAFLKYAAEAVASGR
jgi:ribosomal-protein-alanine N-acetyltransferase